MLALAREDAVIWPPKQMVSRLRQAVKASKLPVMIYTRRQWWQQYIADSKVFSHLPLWDCDLGKPDLENFTPYGGWKEQTMQQFRFDYDLGDIAVDLNVYR